MSDWADEIGARIAFAHGNKPSISSAANEIASALRAARADALEEAARVAIDSYWMIDGVHVRIATAIRALKNKEKAG